MEHQECFCTSSSQTHRCFCLDTENDISIMCCTFLQMFLVELQFVHKGLLMCCKCVCSSCGITVLTNKGIQEKNSDFYLQLSTSFPFLKNSLHYIITFSILCCTHSQVHIYLHNDNIVADTDDTCIMISFTHKFRAPMNRCFICIV